MTEQDHLAVGGFCALTDEDLAALAAELQLALTAAQLQYLRRVYRDKMKRDPLVAELRFLADFATHMAGLTGDGRVTAPTFEDAGTARAWRDLCRQRAELGEDGAVCLRDIPCVSGRYLARCGVFALPRFAAAPAAELDALGITPLVTGENGIGAAELTAPPKPRRDTTALVALYPAGEADFGEQVRAFLARHAALRLVPFALPGAEGLLPHLAALPGIALNAQDIPEVAAGGPGALCTAARGALLLLAPPYAIPQLFDGETPLALYGTVQQSRTLILNGGGKRLLALPYPLLSAWCTGKTVSPFVPTEAPGAPATAAAERQGGCVTAMVRAAGDVRTAVIALFAAALEQGATPAGLTATTTLELPLGTPAEKTLPLLLGFHRAAAELALPLRHHRTLYAAKDGKPTLSVFLTATAGRTPGDDEVAAIREAAAHADVAALRALAQKF